MKPSQGKKDGPIIFGCVHENGSWELTRDDRLICYVPDKGRAIEMLKGFVDAVRLRGGSAELVLSLTPSRRPPRYRVSRIAH